MSKSEESHIANVVDVLAHDVLDAAHDRVGDMASGEAVFRLLELLAVIVFTQEVTAAIALLAIITLAYASLHGAVMLREHKERKAHTERPIYWTPESWRHAWDD